MYARSVFGMAVGKAAVLVKCEKKLLELCEAMEASE